MLRLGTRGSKLALAQSGQVAAEITEKTGVPVELVVISTRGDRILDKPLAEIGGKGLFTLELEEALRTGSIDFAVHSLKDLPTEDPEGLCISSIPKRADPRDVLVGSSLKDSSIVGTGSLRRGVQLKHLDPRIEIRGIRGNVDTRLAKLDAGDYDSIVLAAAGLSRLGIVREDMRFLSPDSIVPAPGQGALAIQSRQDDERVEAMLRVVHDKDTAQCVHLERIFLAAIQGGCNVPAGCFVTKDDKGYFVRAFLETATTQYVSFQAEDMEKAQRKLLSTYGL